jgi:hypothetical protein
MRFYKEAKKAGLGTLEELNEFFWAWLDECYHKVKHSTLKMEPLVRWQKEEERIERISQEKIQQCLQLRARRTVHTKTAQIKLNGRCYQASQSQAGKRVQLRWPFDDESAVNIWRNGVFVERAELYVTPSDIDYSKRPQRKREEEEKILECSKQFRLALVASYRGEKAPKDTSRYGVLSEREFTYVMEQCLQRKVGDAEGMSGLLAESYRRIYPVDAAFVEGCMTKAVASKGTGKHLSFYLSRLEEMRKFKE